jgi:hypothetical protein
MSNFYKVLFLVVAAITSTSSFALKGFDSSNRSIGSEDKSIEIRRENSDGTRSKIRGEVDSSGDFRGRDREGNRFKGSIDSDGYGKIRDSDGNTTKVKPRY